MRCSGEAIGYFRDVGHLRVGLLLFSLICSHYKGLFQCLKQTKFFLTTASSQFLHLIFSLSAYLPDRLLIYQSLDEQWPQ